MLQCSFSFAAAQLLVKMTSALQKSECCSATSAVQHSKNCSATSVFACRMLQGWGLEGRTPKGTYSPRGCSRHLLEIPFSEPLLRTLLRTLFYCKTHSRPPSQNPSENPFPRTLPRTFSEAFSERYVAVRPLGRASKWKVRKRRAYYKTPPQKTVLDPPPTL